LRTGTPTLHKRMIRQHQPETEKEQAHQSVEINVLCQIIGI